MNRDQAIARIGVRRRIATCRACDLCQPPTIMPVPFTGPAPARYVVLGEAPGRTENHYREPFVGASGKLLRRLMGSVGLVTAEAMWCNVASCWPPGAPTQSQVDACRPNLVAQLELAGTRYVLATGATALTALAIDGHVRRLHGKALTVQLPRSPEKRSLELVVVPVYHPAFIMRDPSSKPVLIDGLGRFKTLLDGITPDLLRGDWCVACEHKATTWDHRQMPYCDKHKVLILLNQRKDKRRRKTERRAAQGRLV